MKVLFVCLGNICRSPLAQGVLESKVDDSWTVDSAGMQDFHIGDSPDERSVKVAKENGIDLTKQKGRVFTKEDFDNFDVIFVMDGSNYEDVMSFNPTEEQKKKVRFITNETSPGENAPVKDPYYGGADNFQTVYEQLDEATDAFLARVNEK